MKNLFAMLLLLAPNLVAGQTGVHRLYTVGNSYNSNPVITSATNTDAIAAFTCSVGNENLLAVQRVDTNGMLIWKKFYSGAIMDGGITTFISATPDNGAVITIADSGGLNSIHILRIDQDGTIAWAKTFSAEIYVATEIPVLTLPDGSILLAHSSQDSFFLKKLDAGGSMIWEKSYNSSGTSLIRPTTLAFQNSGIYIGGYDVGSYSNFLMKTDADGNILWQHTGGDIGYPVTHLRTFASGNVLISTAAMQNSKVILFDANGALIWARKLLLSDPVLAPVDANRTALCAVQDGIVRTVVFDSLGNILNAKTYHDSLAGTDLAIAATDYRGLWMSSTNQHQLWLAKASQTGDAGCFTMDDTISFQPHSFVSANYDLSAQDYTTTLADATLTPENIQLSDSAICTPLRVEQPAVRAPKIYPDPALDQIMIDLGEGTGPVRFEVYDASGSVVARGCASGVSMLDCSRWKAGLYLIRLTGSTGEQFCFRTFKQ